MSSTKMIGILSASAGLLFVLVAAFMLLVGSPILLASILLASERCRICFHRRNDCGSLWP